MLRSCRQHPAAAGGQVHRTGWLGNVLTETLQQLRQQVAWGAGVQLCLRLNPFLC